jgi:hypothetical protein
LLTGPAIDILIGESYDYSVVGARLMVVKRGWSWPNSTVFNQERVALVGQFKYIFIISNFPLLR